MRDAWVRTFPELTTRGALLDFLEVDDAELRHSPRRAFRRKLFNYLGAIDELGLCVCGTSRAPKYLEAIFKDFYDKMDSKPVFTWVRDRHPEVWNQARKTLVNARLNQLRRFGLQRNLKGRAMRHHTFIQYEEVTDGE